MGLKYQGVIKSWADICNYNCIQLLQSHKSYLKKVGYNNFSTTATVSRGIAVMVRQENQGVVAQTGYILYDLNFKQLCVPLAGKRRHFIPEDQTEHVRTLAKSSIKHTLSCFSRTYKKYIDPDHIKLNYWRVHTFPCSKTRQQFQYAKGQTKTLELGNSRQKSFHLNTILKPSPKNDTSALSCHVFWLLITTLSSL